LGLSAAHAPSHNRTTLITRSQVVVDCVEGAFDVFLQLGGDWAAITVAQLAAAIRGRLELEWG
jgi:hypothetical protein